MVCGIEQLFFLSRINILPGTKSLALTLYSFSDHLCRFSSGPPVSHGKVNIDKFSSIPSAFTLLYFLCIHLYFVDNFFIFLIDFLILFLSFFTTSHSFTIGSDHHHMRAWPIGMWRGRGVEARGDFPPFNGIISQFQL